MDPNTSKKLALLSTLYLSQGLPFGFFTQAVPAVLRQQGLSLEVVGLSSLLALPWAVKFLWAPVVDKYGSRTFGRRRSWIVPLQAIAVVIFGLLALFEPENALTALAAGMLVANLLAATQDIATDGLAVDLLEPHERGLGNGVQVAGYRVGMIVGGGALLVVYDRVGWSMTFLAMALLLALASVPILLHREAPSRPAPAESPARMVVQALSRPGIGGWLVLLVTYKFGDAIGSGMLRPFLVDIGQSLEDIGWLVGAGGSVAGLLGALAGGWGVGVLGRRTALLAFGITQSLAVAGYALVALDPGSPALLWGVCLLDHFAGGTATAALFTVMMDSCRPDLAATDYTVQACVVVLATGIAAAVSGYLAANVGYVLHFLISGGVAFVGVAVVFLRYAPLETEP